MGKPVVYGPGLSSYVRTVRLTLEEKGVDYELVEFDMLRGMPEEQQARHPFGKVPSLSHDGFDLYETAAICRYVDEAFDGPALQPRDVRARARMAQIIGVLDAYTYRPTVGAVVMQRLVVPRLGGVPDESVILSALPAVQRALDVLEAELGERTCLVGDGLTLADLHLLPMYAYFSMTPDAGPILEPKPALRRWWAALSRRESMTATEPELP